MNPKLFQKITDTYYDFVLDKIPLTEEWGRQATANEALGGNILSDEGIALYDLIEDNKNVMTVLQIGTYIGYSGVFMALPLKERNGTMITIDPNHPHRNIDSPLNWTKEIYNKLGIDNVHFIEGYSNQKNSIYDQTMKFVDTPDTQENVLNDLIQENKKFDLIFIDGCHNPDIIRQDFHKSVELLSPKGIIVMHDVNGTDRVKLVVQEMQKSYKEFSYTNTSTPAGLGIFKRGYDGKE